MSTLKASTVVSVIQNKRGLLTVRLVCVCSETDPIYFLPSCSFPQLIWTLHGVSSIILDFGLTFVSARSLTRYFELARFKLVVAKDNFLNNYCSLGYSRIKCKMT